MGTDVMTTESPIDLIERRLNEHGVAKVRRRGDTIEACCPAHDDTNPSLSIAAGTKGRDVVVHCHAGCQPGDVLRVLDLRWTDFGTGSNDPEAVYNYLTADGEIVYQVVRFPGKQFRQRHMTILGDWVWNIKGVDRVLYRLPQVLAAVAHRETIWLVEGEKDADRMCAAGVTATCNSGGAGKMTLDAIEVLRGADVVIVADRDEPGRMHARDVRSMLRARGCEPRVVEAITGKDAYDHLAAGHGLDDFAPIDLDAEPAPELPTVDDVDDEWAPIDLAAIATEIIAGTRTPTLPTIMPVIGGLPLFYGDGRINQLFGESGGGKTWVALATVADVIRGGQRALIVDYEDHAAGITERLVLLGCTVDEIRRVDYRNPTTGLGMGLGVILEGDDDE